MSIIMCVSECMAHVSECMAHTLPTTCPANLKYLTAELKKKQNKVSPENTSLGAIGLELTMVGLNMRRRVRLIREAVGHLNEQSLVRVEHLLRQREVPFPAEEHNTTENYSQ